jgi:hypothetical protein
MDNSVQLNRSPFIRSEGSLHTFLLLTGGRFFATRHLDSEYLAGR